MAERHRTRALEAALDRYWDDILASASPPGTDIDPDLAATAQRVHALDAAPGLHPAFASTLWEQLMTAQTVSPALAAESLSSLPVRPIRVSPRRFIPAHSPSMSRFAAAMLLIVLLAGSAFAALYPLRLWDHERMPLFAPLGTPTAEPELTNQRVLVDFTLTDVEPFTAEGGIAITDYPAGGSSRELAGRESPEIFYIASGSLSMSVEESPQPVRVIPPLGNGSGTPEQMLEQGAEATLKTGSVVFLPERSIVNLGNSGSDPASMIDLLWATESYSTEAGNARWMRVSVPDRQEIVPPTTITLRQSTLAADETIAGSASEAVAMSAAAVATEHRWNLRSTSGGGFRNDAEESIEIYTLQVKSGPEARADSAASTAPQAAGAIEFLWKSDGGPERLSRPYGLGIDPQGNVWVSDANNDRFQILAADGTHLETWGSEGNGEGEFEFYSPNSGFGAPYGDVAFDAAGNIYVADTGNFRVQKFAPDRSFLLAWGNEGVEDGQFMAPSSIAVGPNGVIHVSDEERADVQMFDADGRFLGTTAQAPDEGPVYMPGGIAVDGDGNVWVADYLGSRILCFSPNGELLTSWGRRGMDNGEVSSPNDVAVDAMGRIYVADDGNNRFQVFTADGQFLAKAGGMNSDDARRFSDAVGVAVGDDGAIYVTDDPSIQAFRLVLP
ncbi:MAG: hypothetical protein H0T18_02240 [Chloroflexia bacterium]|nr:hypothetical protein [Chloroflexia bacterium]